jgi:hypothetical protein
MAHMLLGTFVLTLPVVAGAQTVTDGYFVETNGILVMEAESIGAFPDDWKNASSSAAPDINLSAGEPTGGDYLSWEGEESPTIPGVSVLVYRFQINNTGVYRFRWRSQVGLGTDTTMFNDTWVRIEADSFYGEQTSTGSIVCPIGYDPAENDCTGGVPVGDGGDGWFKVYSTSANTWSWSTVTSDFDGHRIFARFDQPGIYELKLSARSSFHIIDRLVLNNDFYQGNVISTELPESRFVPNNLPPPNPDVLFSDGFETP